MPKLSKKKRQELIGASDTQQGAKNNMDISSIVKNINNLRKSLVKTLGDTVQATDEVEALRFQSENDHAMQTSGDYQKVDSVAQKLKELEDAISASIEISEEIKAELYGNKTTLEEFQDENPVGSSDSTVRAYRMLRKASRRRRRRRR